MIQCKHATPQEGQRHVLCSLGLFGGKPSTGICLTCKSYEGPSRGLGDTVAKAIQTITLGTVKPCLPCKARQARLNKALPYANQ
jgi:hypothetical protein